ncbi:MAG: hypothetical protein Q8L01_00690, partial [Candidatus Woesebacteria bacterium]|nr:hypothetical protein [Candidatus Woesebacteria bacterium]
GEIDTSIDCGLNCIQDNYSLIDANLGVNKANYFIERSQEVDLIVNKEYINHELVVKYNNNATNVVGARGLYKNYTRLLIPQESTNVSIKAINSNGDFTNLEFDSVEINNRKEIGFLLEVLPGSSQKIQIVWDLPNDKLKQGGEYKILIRKQAGTNDDGLKVNVVSKDLSLTGKALPVYNTTLARDFSASLFFK